MPDLYAVGPELLRYAVDPGTATLALSQSVSLPGNGQYAALHPAGNSLYVATGKEPQPLHVLAFAIDPVSGALRPMALPSRSPGGRSIWRSIPPAVTCSCRCWIPAPSWSSGLRTTARSAGRVAARPAAGGRVPAPGPRDPDGQIAARLRARQRCDRARARRPWRDHPVHDRRRRAEPSAAARHAARRRTAPSRFRSGRHGAPTSPSSAATRSASSRLRETRSIPSRCPSRRRSPSPIARPPGSAPGRSTSILRPVRLCQQSRAARRGRERAAELRRRGEQHRGVRSDPAGGQPVLVQHAPVHGLEPRSFAIDPSGRLLIAGEPVSRPGRPGEPGRVRNGRGRPARAQARRLAGKGGYRLGWLRTSIQSGARLAHETCRPRRADVACGRLPGS